MSYLLYLPAAPSSAPLIVMEIAPKHL